jgi:uncharacterized membrane protein YdjX (TVP38/TMEM64 family)
MLLGDLTPLLATRAFTLVLLMRLPYLGNGLLNYAFSLSDVAVRPYLLANAVGMLPGSFLFAALGLNAKSLLSVLTEGSANGSTIAIVVVQACIMVAAVVSCTVLVRRWKRKALELEQQQQQQQQLEQALEGEHQGAEAASVEQP